MLGGRADVEHRLRVGTGSREETLGPWRSDEGGKEGTKPDVIVNWLFLQQFSGMF